MKLNKKKVLVASLAVSLVAILSFGTIAWFSDTDEVTNTFKVATSTEKPDDIFSVEVFEQVDTNGDGQYDAALSAPTGYTYEDILPGDNLLKKPWVKNTGAYAQYIRVKVTIDNAADWKAITQEYGLKLADIFKGHDETLWTRNDAETVDDITNDKLTYVYYLNKILEPGKSVSLFSSVLIPEQITREDMATFAGGIFTVNIVAEAVQTEHVGANAIAAFDTVMDNK